MYAGARLLELPEPAYSLSQGRSKPSGLVEEGFRAHREGLGGWCWEGLGGHKEWEGTQGPGGSWKRFSGVWRAYVLRSFVTVLIIYIWYPHVPTPFLMYVRKCVAHGGERCKVTKTMIL